MTVELAKIAIELGRAAPDPDTALAKQWQMWIDDAEMLIEDRAAELGIDVPDEKKVDYVVRQAVVAHIRKPDDATQVTVSVDDGSTSKTYQSGQGRVAITDDWWSFLGLVKASGGAYSFDTAPGRGSRHVPWCNLLWGATYCSCGADIAGTPIYENRP
ncbi:Gp19/Gp15/Gp42 family protein [Curtobacterium flaccumfaciens]|nr:Gp19/Gp15/Gp42 family protein [Curtobacterium flaccumfaciens]